MGLAKKATLVASMTAFSLTVMKLIVGIMTSSVAVISSAVDSLLDTCVSIFNAFAVKESEKESDDEYNHWREKILAIASFVEGVVISLSGLFIIYSWIQKIINNEEVANLGLGIWVILISFVVTGGLVLFLDYVAKKTNNLVIKADSLHYKTDLYSNGAILIGLLAIHFTGLHLVDAVLGIWIGAFVIYSAWELISEGYDLLMDKALNKETQDEILDIITSPKEVTSYHLFKTIAGVKTNYVTFHLVFSIDTKLIDAHKVFHKVEAKIKRLDREKNWEVVAHLDPYDDEACDVFDERKN